MDQATTDGSLSADELLRIVSDRLNLRFSTSEAESEFRKRFNIGDTEWEQIQLYRARRNRKAVREAHKQWIEGLEVKYADEAVLHFLNDHFKGAKAAEKEFIKEQISKEAKASDLDYDYSLDDIVRDGLRGVRQHHRKRHLKYFRHTWAAVKAIVAVGVVLGLYSKLQTDFEIIACSLLFLLYTHVNRRTWGLSLSTASFNQAGFMRYMAIKEAFGFHAQPDEWQARWDLDKGIKTSMIRYYVVDTGNGIVNLIAYWHLVTLAFK